MSDPLRLAATAVELGAAYYGRPRPQRIAVVIGGVSASAGAGFAVAALLIYLIPISGVAGAALAVAGLLIALACAALGISGYLARRPHGQRATHQADLASLATGAENFVRENKTLVLLAAFIAGLLAADEGRRSR